MNSAMKKRLGLIRSNNMRKEDSDSLKTHSSSPIVLKNESRIVAMAMIMGLALMIHSLAERKLRETLEKIDAVSQLLPLFHPKSREKEKRGIKGKESDVTCAYE